ncbi:hypothetical protein C8F04DRAFT_1399939 [Mycena alexandri]|uniref:Uncharacterized protein n=1 Tax=Mycena alexandri TaxID=1745969 RepID=A0AAD6SH29_9AGAR|nr:hypothetical protein C8F04DRAFT_1399939 [Mycena alexandri]
MFNKVVSTAIFFLAFTQVVMCIPGPGPVELHCGRPYDRPCGSGQLCCGTDPNNMHCQAAGLLCLVPPPQ